MISKPKTWTPYQNYIVGTIVNYDGLSYQALQEETSIPSWDPADTATLWAPIAASSGSAATSGPSSALQNVPELWLASAIYTTGMVATVNGVSYQANCWTQGNNPVDSSGPSGSGKPWTLVGTLVVDGVVPAPPAGLAVSSVTSTTATLQWQASAAATTKV